MTTKYTAWPTGRHDEVRARIYKHRIDDEVIQGLGFVEGLGGCAIGCSLDEYSWERYRDVLGIPIQVAYLVDAIHEKLPRASATRWPSRIAEALIPGADTTHVWSRFVQWLLLKECPSEVGSLVAALYRRRIESDEPSVEEWTAVDASINEAWNATQASWVATRDNAKHLDLMTVGIANDMFKSHNSDDSSNYWDVSNAVTMVTRRAEGSTAGWDACERMADKLVQIIKETTP